MSIAIFVPIYNDEETIDRVLGMIPKRIGSLDIAVFVVDDGSSDNSFAIAKKYARYAIRHQTNKGVGAATKTGLLAISEFNHFDYVVKFDADGQHDPMLITEVILKLKKNADVVICSRFHEESDTQHAFVDRLFLNTSAASWVNRVTGWKISDARSGFMGFRAELIKPIAREIITDRYGIPIELLLRIYYHRPDVSVHEIPHPAMYNTDISSKLNHKYGKEEIAEKVNRMTIAYTAFLKILESLGMDLRGSRVEKMVI